MAITSYRSNSKTTSSSATMRNLLLVCCGALSPTSSAAFSPSKRISVIGKVPFLNKKLGASATMSPDDDKVIDVDFVKTFVDKFTNKNSPSKKNDENSEQSQNNYFENSNYYEDHDYHFNHDQYQFRNYQDAQEFQDFQQNQAFQDPYHDREFYYDHNHNLFQRMWQDVFGRGNHINFYEQEQYFQQQQQQFLEEEEMQFQQFQQEQLYEARLEQEAFQAQMERNQQQNQQLRRLQEQRQNQQALYYNHNDPDYLFQQLYHEVCGYHEQSNIHLTSFDDHDGVRGVATNRPFRAGETIVRIPISSCVRANEPLSNREGSSLETGLLAASIIQQFRNADQQFTQMLSIYKQLLPAAEELKFFLPVRWSPQEIKQLLPLAGSRRLQFGLDTALNRREQHVKDVFKVLENQQAPSCTVEEAHAALDLVQSRACRVTLPYRNGNEREQVSLPIMAPIFDFINHGDPDTVNAYYSIEYGGNGGNERNANSNARGAGGRNNNSGNLHNTDDPSTLPLQDYYLTIKAYRPLMAGEQILLDYGSSAHPSWQCLLSYGFVPNLYGPVDQNEKVEINVDGEFFEVTANSIPYYLVAHLAQTRGGEDLDSWRPEVTPDMAMDIIEILNKAAFDLGKDIVGPMRQRKTASYAAQSISDLRHAQQRVLLTLKDAIERHADMLWSNWNMANWQVDKNDEVVFPIY